MKKMILFLIFGIILAGCATPGSFTGYHHAANPYSVTNEKYVDTSPDTVWDSLVKEISKSYFMINNIDKESRIMNISFSSSNVCDYVDCGQGEIKVKKSSLNKRGMELYEFDICDSNKYVVDNGYMDPSGIMAPVICDVSRKSTLEGRMNIYVAPDGNGTLVTVNCRYIVTINLSDNCEYYAPAGNLVNVQQNRDSYKCSLDSKRPFPCEPLKGDPFMCHSTGNLEKEILSLVK